MKSHPSTLSQALGAGPPRNGAFAFANLLAGIDEVAADAARANTSSLIVAGSGRLFPLADGMFDDCWPR